MDFYLRACTTTIKVYDKLCETDATVDLQLSEILHVNLNALFFV